MREIWEHTPGRIYLASLVISVVAMILVIASGLLEAKVVVLGFMTMPLVVGALFVVFWLIAYLIYFFVYWPYR